MAKISPVSAKYIVHTSIGIEGTVDNPDVIGAIFGQTEGLLGNELELRELQRSGRIGRIEVNTSTQGGKTAGTIIIPSSLDKAETSIIAAALETIQRIGPCNSKVNVEKIEDVRVSKRNFVIDRAKELLKNLQDNVLPDSQEITDSVTESVRMMEITEYGKDRLAAGPNIDDSEEIVVVEGRADVVNLLKQGIKNSIALNGTAIPDTIKILGKHKVLTVFVDGDRGGDLIIKGLINAGVEIDFVIKAPDGKEVEEITKKEILKALRNKIAIEQIKMDLSKIESKPPSRPTFQKTTSKPVQRPVQKPVNNGANLSDPLKKKFKELLEDLVGTRGAFLLDTNLQILGKVPLTELDSTLKTLKSVYAVVFDGAIDRNLTVCAESCQVKYLVANQSSMNPKDTRVNLLTGTELR